MPKDKKNNAKKGLALARAKPNLTDIYHHLFNLRSHFTLSLELPISVLGSLYLLLSLFLV